jgi:predicted enzyme related to lactoylglutathione lyase
MTEHISHPPGTFCFAELHTPDLDLAKRFYGELLGWTATDAPDCFGAYTLFRVNGRDVAAGRRVPECLPRWVNYVCVDDAALMSERAQQLGAKTIMPGASLPGLARTCVLQDPEGAVFGLWEARGHCGARLQDDHGSMWWSELLARDISGARSFYTALFGWSAMLTMKYGPPYTVFKAGDVSAAGAIQFGLDWGLTPQWTVFFSIPDWQATVTLAKALGGVIEFWRDVPQTGRLAVLRDAENARFVVMQPGAATSDAR